RLETRPTRGSLGSQRGSTTPLVGSITYWRPSGYRSGLRRSTGSAGPAGSAPGAMLRDDDADAVARHALHAHGRQRCEERRAVVLEDHAAVEQDHRATIGLGPDQPAVPLPQPQGCERELVLAERILGSPRATL